MAEDILSVRKRFISDPKLRTISSGSRKCISQLADFGLMNGAMITRAVGESVGGAESASKNPVARSLIGELVLCTALSIGSLGDKEANRQMITIFGDEYRKAFRTLSKIERAMACGNGEPSLPREVVEDDYAEVDLSEKIMASHGAEYLGNRFETTEKDEANQTGCPLRVEREEGVSDFIVVCSSLVDSYLDTGSPFFGKAYYGPAGLVLQRVISAHEGNLANIEARFDWSVN